MELAYCDIKIANSRPHSKLEAKVKGTLPVLPLAGKNKNGVEKLITTVVGKACSVIVKRLFDAYVLVWTSIVGPSSLS